MIITDIEQIDRIAKETFGTTKGIISIDMNDYAHIKEQSLSLNAITIEIPEITEDNIIELDGVLNELCKGEDCNILLYISGSGVDPGVRTLTVGQLQLFHESIERCVPQDANIIWGIGESKNAHNGIAILVIVGMRK